MNVRVDSVTQGQGLAGVEVADLNGAWGGVGEQGRFHRRMHEVEVPPTAVCARDEVTDGLVVGVCDCVAEPEVVRARSLRADGESSRRGDQAPYVQSKRTRQLVEFLDFAIVSIGRVVASLLVSTHRTTFPRAWLMVGRIELHEEAAGMSAQIAR